MATFAEETLLRGEENDPQTVECKDVSNRKTQDKTGVYFAVSLYETVRVKELLTGLSIAYDNTVQNDILEPQEISSIVNLEDLKIGQILTGFVNYNTRVGSSIDIGVGYDGFLHKANFKGHCLYIGTRVEVQIEDVNYTNKKIGLNIIRIIEDEIEPIDPYSLNVSLKMTCSVCQFDFSSREEQVQHYKLDWHRYNLKQKLQGLESVSEESFDNLAGGISSLSGSDSEESGSESTSGSDAINSSPRRKPKLITSAMIKRKLSHRERSVSVTSTDTECEEDSRPQQSLDDGGPKSRVPIKLFLRNKEGNILALHRCMIHSKENVPENASGLLALVQSLLVQTKLAIFLIGGGHFAAAIMQGGECVAHKTFHRYTVRAKQGGSQGARDGKQGGHQPKSAGSSLRRYNEAALVKDIQDLMLAWNEELQSCHRIFFRAASFNRTALFGGKTPPFRKNDQRLRTIPFPTRRATFNEVKRIHKILSDVECFGPEKLYKDSIPQSPKVFLGSKSPKKALKKLDQKDELGKVVENERVRIKLPVKLDLDERELNDDLDVSDGEVSETNLECVDEVHDTNHLKEFSITRKTRKRKSKRKPINRHQQDPLSTPIDGEEYQFRTALYSACKTGDVEKLMRFLSIAEKPKDNNSLPDDNSTISKPLCEELAMDNELNIQEQNINKMETNASGIENGNGCQTELLTTQNWPYSLSVLSEPIGDGGGTLLHVAAQESHKDIVKILMEHGADPTAKNKQGYTPYTLAAEKETRNEFRRFWAENPEKFEYSKTQIPGPLTEEQEKEQNEKNVERKKEKRKQRKEKFKEKKAEESERKAEVDQQERFLALSDREKRALAAERRILANAQSKEETIVLSRCFQCASDITGKVPFEYNDNRFCSVKCVQKHRKKP